MNRFEQDKIARHNKERWEALVAAGVQYSRPWRDLTEASARERVDPEGLIGEVSGRRVLCLAGGGGQQTAAFALLGAEVTVLTSRPCSRRGWWCGRDGRAEARNELDSCCRISMPILWYEHGTRHDRV